MTEQVRSTRQQLDDALAKLPTAEGGSAMVLATAGQPPAMALLSSGDVHVTDDGVVRVAVFRGSSAASRLGSAFTILVPTGEEVLRVEVAEAKARRPGQLAILEGVLSDIRPTAEPPWVLEMRFRAVSEEGVAEHLEYWHLVRTWLASGADSSPPEPP